MSIGNENNYSDKNSPNNLTNEDIENTSDTSDQETIEKALGNKNDPEMENSTPRNMKARIDFYKIIRIICAIGFVIFTALFINEVFIQPYRANQVTDETRDLYKVSVTPAPQVTSTPKVTVFPKVSASLIQDSNRDSQGRLLKFEDLLNKNPDTKGWITIPNTNIDYVVVQNRENPDFYLTHDFNKERQKAGCLFLDTNSSVEENTKNMLIYGHNMKSTNNMFHYLEHMKKLEYFKDRTVFNFDTLYQTGQWKIFSVFITPGSDEKEPFFDFTRAHFTSNSDYLNFIYQLRIRSMYNLDSVDINENDQIVTLVTCSYEINNYRLVIAARKVRDGEAPTVNTASTKNNSKALFPKLYYDTYGGKAPSYPVTFEAALKQGLVSWYKAPNQGAK